MNSGSDSRKRKTPSSPNKMGGIVSKFFRKEEEKAEDASSSSKGDENSPVVEAAAASRIAGGADQEHVVDDKVVDKTDVQPSPSKDDAPPPLDRQDDQPSEELPLDDTPESSPASSPEAKSEKKKKEKEEADEDVEVDKVVKRQSSLRSSKKKKTIADFGYHFNAEGVLRTIEGDEGFKFTTQKEYEELGELIGDRVYELLEEAGLSKRYFEIGRNRRFYFASPDFESKERILVLIHGSGVVKAGQWARKLIINESLDRGTQLPYIKRGLANDWGVVVLNYNERCVGQEKGCHSPDAHGCTEWKFAMEKAPDAEIVVVAHSYGGSVISEVVKKMHRADDDRVLCVALTDSWFSEGRQVFAVNWNTMKKQMHRSNGTYQMYSGDNTHEGTSASCINSCFALLEGVQQDTSMDEFHDLLEDCERIIKEEFQAKQKKKREADAAAGDSSSAKSLELEEPRNKDDVKIGKVKKEKEEGKEAKEEEQKENGDKKEQEAGGKEKDGTEVKKEASADEEKEEKKEEGEEKKDDTTEKEQKMEVDEPRVAERNAVGDEEEDSDEGVEKDASTPDNKSDAENCVATVAPDR